MTTVDMMTLLSMTTEALDEHEYPCGGRSEALDFAGWTFAAKAANGLGALLSGLALQLIDFPANEAGAGVPAAIPEQTSRLLGLIYGPGTAY